MKPLFVEPDIHVTHDDCAYGIAVKRIKSAEQIEKHIRKAADQIARTGSPGFIVIDISMAFNPPNKRMTGASDEALKRAHRLSRSDFESDYFDRLKQWVRGREVRGVILLDHIVRQHPQDGWELNSFTYAISLSRKWLTNKHEHEQVLNQQRHREFVAFMDRFVNGLATPPS